MEDTILCPICNLWYRQLSKHIRTHGFKTNEFKEKYPNIKLKSEKLIHEEKCRNQQSKFFDICIKYNQNLRKTNIAKYELNPKQCIKCKINIQYKSRANKFCSRSCSRSYYNINSHRSNETKLNTSNTLRERHGNKKFNLTIYKSTKLYYFCCKVCKLTEVRRQRERKKICDNCKIKLNQDRITKSKKQRKLIVIDKLKEISYKKNQPITDIEIQRRNRLSNIAKSRNLGGYKEGSGRGKKGRYNGFWCDSSYELAFIYYMVSQGKTIQRNTIKYNYIFDDKEYKWMPDFIIDV